jgi:hypothetical protein
MITLTAATAADMVVAVTAITLITAVAFVGIAAINTRVIEHPRTTHNKQRDAEPLTAWLPRSRETHMGMHMDDRPRDL